MEDNGSLSRAQCSVLLWSFLQTDCGEYPQEYRNEVLSLGQGFKHPEASLYSSTCGKTEDLESGELETDGHLSSSIAIALEGIEPAVDAQAPDIQHVAAELREIAAQLELRVIARATSNLTRNLLESSSMQLWKDYLHQEVQKILTHGVGLQDNLQQERVVAALVFTLVKGVCLQAPRLIRSLFNTTLQYLSHGGR